MRSLLEKFLQVKLPDLLNNHDVYNEFSLQHELGIYLRDELRKQNPDYRVQFERNATSYFGIVGTVKHEIDIAVFKMDADGNPTEKLAAIELKFPKNGQHPEQMYQFVKDISFMEQVKNGGFEQAYCITLVDDPKFYEKKNKITEIYSYFRVEENGGEAIPFKPEVIIKPTGNGEGSVELTASHKTKSVELTAFHETKWKK